MATTKSVDASLWWDPFSDLLTELENLSLSSKLPISLANKLEENHSWLLNSVFLFKQPNQKSREALDSQQVQIGSHQLTIQAKFKELAVKISSSLFVVVAEVVAEINSGRRKTKAPTSATAETKTDFSYVVHVIGLLPQAPKSSRNAATLNGS